MFQNQHGALSQALQRAGLNPSAASEIARILSNPQQELRTGPIKQDLTPRNMRQVRRDDRLTLPGLDQRDDDPYYRRQVNPTSEERYTPTPTSAVTGTAAPQQTEDAAGTVAGQFIETSPDGEAAKISLRLNGEEGGIVTAQYSDGSLRSKAFRAESDAGSLRFSIEDYGSEIVWKLMFMERIGASVDVVTNVELDGNNIRVSKARVYPVAWEPLDPTFIPVEECQ